MTVVTSVDKHGISIAYFDGIDQLIPFQGFYVEGDAPWVPEDESPGWVCFEVTPTYPRTDPDYYFRTARELAEKLFCDLGFTADQVIELMEDF